MRKLKPQHFAKADGHGGITGKIEIDLQRKGHNAQPRQRGGNIAVPQPFDIFPQGTNAVGKQHLFAKAQNKQPHAIADALQRVAALQYFQLRSNVSIKHDRPGDQLGKHHHIGAQCDNVVFGVNTAAVDIQCVAHGLERIKTDAQRQRKFEQRDSGAQQAVDIGDEEIAVFEKEQHADIEHDHQHQQQFLNACPLPGAPQ